MFVVLVILVLAIIGCIIWTVKADDYAEIPIVIVIFLGVVAFFLFVASCKWQISSESLTGYIYQRSEQWGYVTYDLRYSQGAGSDDQPSFCVKSGSKQDKKMIEYVGSSDKVFITVPNNGFFVANNPFKCASEAVLDKTIKGNEQL